MAKAMPAGNSFHHKHIAHNCLFCSLSAALSFSTSQKPKKPTHNAFHYVEGQKNKQLN